MTMLNKITRGFTHGDCGNAHYLLSRDVEARNCDIRRWLEDTCLPFVEHAGPWHKDPARQKTAWPAPVAIGNVWELVWASQSPYMNVLCRVFVFNQFYERWGKELLGVSPLPTTCASFIGGSRAWGDEFTWCRMQCIDDNEASVMYGILSALPVIDPNGEWDGPIPPRPPNRTDFFYEFRLGRWKQKARAAMMMRWAWNAGADGSGALSLAQCRDESGAVSVVT